MRTDAFHYELPPDRIAQRPADEREAARLMVLPPGGGAPAHHTVRDLAELVPRGALVVVNDTRVIPARLLGHKVDTRGRVEIFLVRRVGRRDLEGGPRDAEIWRAMGRASKGLRAGMEVEVGALIVRILDRSAATSGVGGASGEREDELLEVAIYTRGGGSIERAIRLEGHVPLPPYIRRDGASSAHPGPHDEAFDRERYQTVYARVDGAVAAPTAGLHLTEGLFDRLRANGCEVCAVTLHVGLGTFQPVTAEDLDAHAMHAEAFEINGDAARAIDRARERNAPVVAVGTTVVRALESAADPERVGRVVAKSGETRLLIQPGFRFRVVDALLTNFHLPRSTLLAMVSAFAGRERILSAYGEAIALGYRFFSYGDAMLLTREGAIPPRDAPKDPLP